MKKLVFSLAVLFSVAMVSCGNKTAEATDSNDTAVVAEVAEVADSNDTTVAAEVAEVVEAPADSAK